MIFSKMWTSSRKIWTVMRHFLKKVHLYLRNVDVLRMIFWKTWTFMYNFFKKVDLNAWGSAKSGKYGPLPRCDFWKKGTLIWEMLSFTREKMLTGTSQACAWIIKKFLWCNFGISPCILYRFIQTAKEYYIIYYYHFLIGLVKCHL